MGLKSFGLSLASTILYANPETTQIYELDCRGTHMYSFARHEIWKFTVFLFQAPLQTGRPNSTLVEVGFVFKLSQQQ